MMPPQCPNVIKNAQKARSLHLPASAKMESVIESMSQPRFVMTVSRVRRTTAHVAVAGPVSVAMKTL